MYMYMYNLAHLLWIACPYGFFGPGCIHECYRTCRGCNTVDGACETGCFPGWKGAICDEGLSLIFFFRVISGYHVFQLLMI